MRILGALLFLLGVVALYFGSAAFVFFADWVLYVPSSLAGIMFLGGAGWLWHRASTMSVCVGHDPDPDSDRAFSHTKIRRGILHHMAVSFCLGTVVIVVVLAVVLNR